MATRKTSKSKTSKEKVLLTTKSKTDSIKSFSRSYVNLVYGAVTVVVIFLLVFFAVRTLTQNRGGDITEESAQTQSTEENVYTVKEGDTLWSIAESEIGSGYNWTDIVEANDIKDPTDLKTGTELIIPEVSPIESGKMAVASGSPSVTQKVEPTKMPSTTVTTAPTKAMEQPTQAPVAPISGTEYTVKSGDNLWDICVRAYGSGYKWVEVARVNKLSNPDLIFSGNKLVLPR